MVAAGEFNTVAERLAQGFIAFKRQHIKLGFTPSPKAGGGCG
jgi:hypothetical protein